MTRKLQSPLASFDRFHDCSWFCSFCWQPKIHRRSAAREMILQWSSDRRRSSFHFWRKREKKIHRRSRKSFHLKNWFLGRVEKKKKNGSKMMSFYFIRFVCRRFWQRRKKQIPKLNLSNSSMDQGLSFLFLYGEVAVWSEVRIMVKERQMSQVRSPVCNQ